MAVSRATRGVLQKCLLKNYIKFTRKHLCRSLFLNKVADLRTATLLKKRLWHRCFSVNFAKFLKTSFCTASRSCFCTFRANQIKLWTSKSNYCSCFLLFTFLYAVSVSVFLFSTLKTLIFAYYLLCELKRYVSIAVLKSSKNV